MVLSASQHPYLQNSAYIIIDFKDLITFLISFFFYHLVTWFYEQNVLTWTNMSYNEFYE